MIKSVTTHPFGALTLFVIALVGVRAYAADTVKASSRELVEFVQQTRRLGLDPAAIRQNAITSGWAAEEVDETLARLKAAEIKPAVPEAEAAGTPVAPAPASTADSLPKGRGVPDDYVIGEGDIVQISVWREPEASVPSAVVRPDGRISMPLLKEVQIAGMTPVEAEKVVARQIASFINVPEVAVVVREIHSKKVYVVGAVKREGPLPYTYRLTVLQALSEAGGVTDYAKRKKIYVLRTEGGAVAAAVRLRRRPEGRAHRAQRPNAARRHAGRAALGRRFHVQSFSIREAHSPAGAQWPFCWPAARPTGSYRPRHTASWGSRIFTSAA